MEVYRVQDAQGYGPYCFSTEQDLWDTIRKAHSDINHPCWRVDFDTEAKDIMWADDRYRFGFDSLQSLYDWFSDFLVELKEHEYRIVVYEVPVDQVLHSISRKQVVFKLARAQERLDHGHCLVDK